jgi:radical SAM-linked protein
MRIVLLFTKLDAMRYISHLDFQRLWQKMFRIAGINLQKTQGYNPHPKMRFAVPLATGFQSVNELLEVYLEEDIEPDQLILAINSIAPQGLGIIAASSVPEAYPKLTAVVDALEYKVEFAVSYDIQEDAKFSDVVQTKGGDVNVSEFLLRHDWEKGSLKLTIKVENQKTLRPDVLVSDLYPSIEIDKIAITRTGIYTRPNERILPLPAGLKFLDLIISCY